MTPTTLVLFDIDGTLILSGRAGVRGMNRAFDTLYGRPLALEGVPIAGRTDRAIVTDVFGSIGHHPSDDAVIALRDLYVERLREEIGKPVADPSGVLPGVHDLLDYLDTLPTVHSGLLTGNFHEGARVKLGHFGLWDRFAFGAFGDDHVDRRALVPIALQRAREAGLTVPSAEGIVVIGDTPLDIDCAQAHGIRALGVATGNFNAEALERAGADLVVETLADPRVARWLHEPTR